MVELRTQPARIKATGTLAQSTLTRICMHVLVPIGIDVRVEREASTLIEQGYEVTIVDLAGENLKKLVEVNKAIRLKHLPVSRDFTITRFKKWATLRAALIFLRGVYTLLRTPTDIYHAHDFNALPAAYIA